MVASVTEIAVVDLFTVGSSYRRSRCLGGEDREEHHSLEVNEGCRLHTTTQVESKHRQFSSSNLPVKIQGGTDQASKGEATEGINNNHGYYGPCARQDKHN